MNFKQKNIKTFSVTDRNVFFIVCVTKDYFYIFKRVLNTIIIICMDKFYSYVLFKPHLYLHVLQTFSTRIVHSLQYVCLFI